jgi:broad specificity phosphatase PhoE
VTTTIHLVRHAVHDRLDRVLCGRMQGVALSAQGRAQAAALAARFAKEPITAIYASPIERARETAEPIAERLGCTVQVREAFTEIDLGSWAGRAFDDLRDDPVWERWNTARSVTRPPGGETMLEAQVRIVAGLERLCAEHPAESVVVVSHADMIKAALAYHLGLPLDAILRFEIGPASVSTLLVGAWGAKVVSLNEKVAA